MTRIAAVLVLPPGSRRRCGGICYRSVDNKDSQGTSYAITRDMQDALFHASPMFSPGVESELALAMTIIGSDMLPMECLYETNNLYSQPIYSFASRKFLAGWAA